MDRPTALGLDRIRRALAAHRPRRLEGPRRAGVAMILVGSGADLEVLFIERSEHPADPWSGQMAFPGGRVDPADAGPRAAAMRETREEVGIELAAAESLGQLDDRDASPGRLGTLILSAFVFRLPGRVPVHCNHEVRSVLWVPLGVLVDPARRVPHPWPPASPLGEFPGILVGEPGRHVVWGLTREVVLHFLDVVQGARREAGGGSLAHRDHGRCEEEERRDHGQVEHRGRRQE